MAIKDLPKYNDIRGTIRRKGRYPVVGTGVKDTIVIHHSMTKQTAKGSTPFAFANTHIDNNKWHGVAYHFVIAPDGTIYHCDDLDRRTYHAGNTNTRSIGICVIGDFRTEGANEKPTKEQEMSLYLLVKELQNTLPKLKTIIGHQECPGYSWKNCPGNTWDYKKVVNGSFLKTTDNVKYRILSGTFASEKDAVKGLERMKKTGLVKVGYIQKDGNFFRVMSGTFNGKESVDKAATAIRKETKFYLNIITA